ncbi:MAG: prolyl aminopeptidase [Rhodospirillaceae bacterium]|nr:prolyl aminopeptidase [Rhodospirillaceae bacterium]
MSDKPLLHRLVDPFDTRMLPVGGGHTLYVEQAGNPEGTPVVFLHGGPGSGCRPDQRRLFDPQRFRMVLFDQRGAGRSTPKRRLEENTTPALVEDMEVIRATLGIERWMVVGGSWGSTLALAYAEDHPDRVTGLVLRAVFLGSRAEVDWAFGAGARTFFPELWRAFVAPLPAEERGDPLTAYGSRLLDPDPRVSLPAARIWHDFEQALSVLKPSRFTLPTALYDDTVTADSPSPNTPFVEWHYFRHDCFMAPGQLLDRAERLADIPGIIVQGRYDMLCPPTNAAALAKRWPAAELRLVPDAGHAISEPGILDGVVKAIPELANKIGG